jgi:hypothetical protein
MFGPKMAIEVTLLPQFGRIRGGDRLARLKFFVIFSVAPAKDSSLKYATAAIPFEDITYGFEEEPLSK